MGGTVHDGHRARLKARFVNEGLDNFEQHNKLELLLFYSIPRIDTNEIAHRLLNRFGTLSAVFDADISELVKVDGVGENTAQLIKLIPALCRAYLDDKYADGAFITSTETAGKFVLSKYVGLTEERVMLVCLDNKCKVLSFDTVYEGSVNASEVSIRKIVEQVVRVNASSVIVSHNHPGGMALPSDADIQTTKRIIAAMRLMGVRVMDHIIVADGDYVSLADSQKYAGLFI